MAIVHGEIGSLKSIRAKLDIHGITRFDSLGDIKSFNRNFLQEKKEITQVAEQAIESEIKDLELKKSKLQTAIRQRLSSESEVFNEKASALQGKIELLEKKNNRTGFNLIRLYRIVFLQLWLSFYEMKFHFLIKRGIWRESKKYIAECRKLHFYLNNKDQLIAARYSRDIDKLERIKEVVDELYPQIAGAIGESSVADELEGLSDEHHVINDFSMTFEPPIFNNKKRYKVHTIQVDHLVISNSGLFILETKNWSQNSIENLDLRSPVEQVRRSSYALFVFLNGKNSNSSRLLAEHHWGGRSIPIRNVLVMAGKKPKEKFKFVKVLSVNQLTGYLDYFEPVFSDAEVKSICDFLNAERK